MMRARPATSTGSVVEAAAVFTFGGTKLVMLEMLTGAQARDPENLSGQADRQIRSVDDRTRSSRSARCSQSHSSRQYR
jgi:hypothetical protein